MPTSASDALWSLDELCAQAQDEMERRHFPHPGGRVADSLNARTVRYYTTLGLVDRPQAYEGGVARYGSRHLLQLVAIKALQAQFLPLPEVQKRLFGRSNAELQAFVDSMSTPASETQLDSWLTCSPIPGLRLVVEDRAAFLDWLRAHPGDALAERLRLAIDLLSSPTSNSARRTPNGSVDH